MRKTISAQLMVMMTLAALLAGVALFGADVRAGSASKSLVAAEGEAPSIVKAAPLSPSDVVSALMAVRSRWNAAGRSAEELRKLDTISIEIADLPGATLAEARGTSIVLDRTAAGWGWYVDPTPFDDGEFEAYTNGITTKKDGAAGRIDLLTAIVHEMLHGVGYADLDPALYGNDVMAGSLPRGTRRLTSAGGGASRNVIAPSFTLPAGRSVTISLDALINKPFPVGIGQVSLQGSISATGLSSIVSDNPATGAPSDPTVTPVFCPPVTVGPTTIAGATAGQAYSQTFTQSGGPGLITFALTGTLPTGVTFNTSTGVLSGTPTQTGSFTFTVTATSENGCSVGTRSYTLTVACPVITIAPPTLPLAILQRPFGPITFTASGGIGTTTLALTGALPAGLTFTASTRTLSGVATETGSFPITITATDQNGCTGTRSYTLLAGGSRIITTGADVLTTPQVRRFTSGDGTVLPGPTGTFNIPTFTQGVRVAEADITGDGVADIITGSGHGVPLTVVVYDGVTGGIAMAKDVGLLPFDHGGLFVAAGDVDGDGRPDIITGAGDNLPLLRVYSGASGAQIWTALVYPLTHTNGARVAAGDVDGDGYADVITGAGYGDPGIVKVFSGATHAELRSFTPYPGFNGGIFVAAGDVNGDGYADIITGAGQGGGPHVRVFNGQTGVELVGYFAYPASFTGGVRVAAGDVNGDGRADVITAPGGGADGAVRQFDGLTGTPIGSPIVGPVPAAQGLFVSTAAPDNRMVIDAPANGAITGSSFRVSGWAFEEGPPGTGVDAVHVWAHPVLFGSPVFLGAATLGDSRPDVGAIFGVRYTPSGYHLDVTGLADGRYDIVVHARNSASGRFNMRRLVRVRVRTPGREVRLSLDTHAGAVPQTFRIVGTAYDPSATPGGSGVDAVHVWAQRVGGGAPTFLGAAVLGDPRPYPEPDPVLGAVAAPASAVADVLPSAPGMVAVSPIGFHLDVAGLAAGDYVVSVSAKASAAADFAAAQTFNVTVAGTSGLTVSIETPSVGIQRDGSFTVTGYALTGKGSGTPGADAVEVWAYPVGGGAAKLLGEATLGVPRSDIGSLFGDAFTKSGFIFAVSNLASGTYDIVVQARGTGSAEPGAPRVVRITIP